MPVKKNGKAASKNNIHEHAIAGYSHSSILDFNNTTSKRTPQHNWKKKKKLKKICRRHVFSFHEDSSFLPNANIGVTLHYKISLLLQPPYNLMSLFTLARQALDCFLSSLAFSQRKHTRLVPNINHSF